MASTVDAERTKEYSESGAELERKLDKLAKMVRASKYTVFFTGAGVSTSAGISGYRGPSGAWIRRRISELENLGDKQTGAEQDELDKLLEVREQEQSKGNGKAKLSVVYLPMYYCGEKVFPAQGEAHGG